MPYGKTIFRRLLTENGDNGRVQIGADRQAWDNADKKAVEAAGEEAFKYSWVGQHKFKGLDRPVKLFRVRRKDGTPK